jgi:signal transduction histidine kinase
MRKNLNIKDKKTTDFAVTSGSAAVENVLCQLTFDNAFRANLIFIVGSGKIVMANALACRLLGYSKKEMLMANANEIFEIRESNLKKLHHSKLPVGQFKDVLTLLKKSGKRLSCKITSATFMGDRHIKTTIATLGDLSRNHQQLRIEAFDDQQLLKAAVQIAQTNSDAAVARVGDLEQKLDKEISMHQLLKSSSRMQKILFKKELDEKVNFEIRLKENQIAEAIIDAKELERSDIGKELHDNVNQLLSATRLYLDMAGRDEANRQLYLDRSSEYTLTAIEEIRKLTKGLTADAIKNFGLYEAVRNICKDTMEVNPIKISYRLDLLIEHAVNDKFKLNVYRIMQEQLTNILKHAKATAITIGLSQNKKNILLSIADNGVGFDPGKKYTGIGITNIRSRSRSYNGMAKFVSHPGQGCVLTVKFPKGELLNQD